MNADHATDAEVQGWVEKSRLAELVAVLSSAVDRGDRELIESCYDEQSYDDHGGFKGSGREFAEYICAPGPGRDAGMLMHHLLGQSIFRVERDEAWGETFFIFHMFNDDKLLPGVGRYIDYFVRAGGTWKIRYRRVVPDWVGSVPAAGSPTMKAYVQAARDRTDPLYDRRRWHD